MKLKNSFSKVETSGCLKEYKFGIRVEDLGMNLNTLRSKMYSDPIGAICREISSNSRDANREVKNENIPVRIIISDDSIFSPGDLTISFEDDGPGISPDRMANIFINYGASTKRDTNKQTGGFGYGAKTPFSYTDNFSIETKVNGIKYSYVAAIEETGTGKIYLLNEEKIADSNGTCIKIPIKKSDRYTFINNVIKNTFFWKVRPAFSFPTELDKIKIEYLENLILIDQNSIFTDHLYLLIDEIPYIIDDQALDFPYSHAYALFMPFKTGELTISANRETVQYDKHTIDKITKRYKSIVSSIFQNFQNELDQQKTYFEACQRLIEIKEKALFKVVDDNKMTNFQFNGQNLSLKWEMKQLQLFRVISQFGDGYKKDQKDSISAEMKKYEIYAIDTPMLSRLKNTELFVKNEDRFFSIEILHRDIKNFSGLNYTEKRAFAKSMRTVVNEIKTLKEQGWPIHFYSEIKIKKEKVERERRKYINVKVVRHNKWKTKFRYQPYSIVDEQKTNSPFTVIYHILTGNETNEEIVHLQGWAKFLNKKDFKTLFIIKKQEKYFKDKMTLEQAIADLDKNEMQRISASLLLTYNEKIKIKQFKSFNFNNGYSKSIKFLNEFKTVSADELPHEFLDKFPVSKEFSDAFNEYKLIYNRYPLLEFFDEYSSGKHKYFSQYVQLIDDNIRMNIIAENTIGLGQLSKEKV